MKLVSHPMSSGVNTTGDMSVLIAVTKVELSKIPNSQLNSQPGNFLRVPAKFGLSLPLGK